MATGAAARASHGHQRCIPQLGQEAEAGLLPQPFLFSSRSLFTVLDLLLFVIFLLHKFSWIPKTRGTSICFSLPPPISPAAELLIYQFCAEQQETT
jgi:hypothetical protein